MSDLVPLQCPKCGGYKIKDDKDGCLDLVLLILTSGLWFFVMLIRAHISSKTPVKTGNKLQCDICGYRWVYQE